MVQNRLNITVRKDGRYMGRFIIGYNSSGKPMYQYVYGRTYEEAEQKLRIGLEIESLWLAGRCITVADAYKEWLHSVENRVKESTLANYRNKFEKHILPVLGERVCSELSADTINAWIHKKVNDGLSVSYIRDIYAVFRTFLRFAERRHRFMLILDDVILPKHEKRETSTICAIEQKRLTDYLESHMDLTAFGILISLTMGLRIGELCGLRWEDVDFRSKCIHINRTVQRICAPENGRRTKLVISSPKSSTSRRIIAIPDRLMPYFQRFHGKSNYYLLTGTTKLTEPRTMQYRYKRVLKQAEVQPHHFHKLRHTFATNCMEHGFDIKTLSVVLGHSNVEITMNRYLHPNLQYERRLMNQVCDALACQSVSELLL